MPTADHEPSAVPSIRVVFRLGFEVVGSHGTPKIRLLFTIKIRGKGKRKSMPNPTYVHTAMGCHMRLSLRPSRSLLPHALVIRTRTNSLRHWTSLARKTVDDGKHPFGFMRRRPVAQIDDCVTEAAQRVVVGGICFHVPRGGKHRILPSDVFLHGTGHIRHFGLSVGRHDRMQSALTGHEIGSVM